MISGQRVLLRFIFPGICASLGTWQVFRWRRKMEAIEELKRIAKTPPIKSDGVDGLKPGQLYSMNLESTAARTFIGPRGMPNCPGGFGSFVFEVAKVKPQDTLVVVNRGVVPRGNESKTIPNISGKVIVVVDDEERRPFLVSDKKGVYWKNWNYLRSTLNLSPQTIVLREVSNDVDGPRDILRKHQLNVVNTVSNRHFEYILTWYSLAGCSVLMSFLRK